MSSPDFATFYAAAWPRLLRTTYAVAGDRQLAEDAAQVALAKAYAVWPRVRGADDPFAYVRRIAVNAALAQHRLAHRRRETTVEVLPERPVPVGADPVERATVLDAVRSLPPRQRAVVVLRYYEDLSEQQIADLLGCRPGTVKSQASAALASLRSGLAGSLADLDPGPGDRAAAEREGARLVRRRRRVVAGATALIVVVGLAVTLGLGRDDGRAEPAPPPADGSWRTLAPMPLEPRRMPVTVWTGEEVVGGGVGTPCLPNASCTDEGSPMARDGAAYDPASDTWRPIADAPVDVGYWFRPALVAGEIVLLGDGHWWAYDLASDEWRTLPDPPRRVLDVGASAVEGGRLYAVARSGQVLVLDVADAAWSELPPSPHVPAISHGTVVATDDGVLVSGAPDVPDWDGDTPIFTLVDRWDGSSWTRLPETGQVGPFSTWTGTRLLAPSLLTATGVDGNPPEGGVLDLTSGEWQPLPNVPPATGAEGGWTPVAIAGPRIAGFGYAYDDRTERWSTLGRPPSTTIDEDQSAVWADDTLVVVGGIDTETGYQRRSGLSKEAWGWTAP